jgi:hypothetical protein
LHAKWLSKKVKNTTPYGFDVTFEGHMLVDDESNHEMWNFEVERIWMIYACP